MPRARVGSDRGRAAVLLGMAALVALAALIGGRHEAHDGPPPVSPIPLDGRSPAAPAGATERVLVRLSRPPLGGLRNPPGDPRARAAYLASLHDEARALRGALGARGIALTGVVPFGRVYDGFAATVRARDLARLPSLGVRAEPVRRFYPTAAVLGPEKGPAGSGGDGVVLLGTPGDPLGGLLPRARVYPVARAHPAPGLPAPEVYATSDTLLAGLERAVARHARVALVTVSAPYAGFADAPEARAARVAARLGTLVVAPAGNEDGPVGSPGGARAALTAGAAPTPSPLPALSTPLGPAVLLGGTLPRRPLRLVPARGGARRFYDRAGRSLVRGKLTVARRDRDPAAQAALAAAAGAAGVVLADPAGRPFPSVAPARAPIPVLAMGGPAATAALGARPGAFPITAEATSGDATQTASGCATRRPTPPRSPFSAATAYGAAKPNVLAAPVAPAPAGTLAGTGVAAARVADRAARALTFRGATPASVRRALSTGVGRRACPAATRVGALRLRRTTRGRAVDGVRLVLGRVRPGFPGLRPIRVEPVGRLELTLLDASGAVARVLTPPGGARDLLPGEYSYTLPPSALSELAPGAYAFRARATPPAGGRATVRTSPRFTR